MRRRLVARCPEAEALDGTAEADPAARRLGRRRLRGRGLPQVRRRARGAGARARPAAGRRARADVEPPRPGRSSRRSRPPSSLPERARPARGGARLRAARPEPEAPFVGRVARARSTARPSRISRRRGSRTRRRSTARTWSHSWPRWAGSATCPTPSGSRCSTRCAPSSPPTSTGGSGRRASTGLGAPVRAIQSNRARPRCEPRTTTKGAPRCASSRRSSMRRSTTSWAPR